MYQDFVERGKEREAETEGEVSQRKKFGRSQEKVGKRIGENSFISPSLSPDPQGAARVNAAPWLASSHEFFLLEVGKREGEGVQCARYSICILD